MALDVYFKEDIRQSIVAVAVAMLSTAVAHGGTNVEYYRGVLDTSRAQALNHGIPWSGVVAALRESLGNVLQAHVLTMLTEVISSEL